MRPVHAYGILWRMVESNPTPEPEFEDDLQPEFDLLRSIRGGRPPSREDVERFTRALWAKPSEEVLERIRQREGDEEC